MCHLVADFQVVNFFLCCNLWVWSDNELSPNLEIYVLSDISVGGMFNNRGRCGCGSHNKRDAAGGL